MQLKTKFENTNNNYFNKVNTSKHFPSLVRQWDNVIYVYNKNTLCIIPNTTKYAMKLIKAYFNVYNKNIELKIRAFKLLSRFRRFSSNKIFLSSGEFKHTNNKVIITLYIFNRQKNNYLLRLKKGYLKKWFINKRINKTLFKSGSLKNKLNLKKVLLKRLKTINIKSLIALNNANENKYSILKILNSKDINNNTQNYKVLTEYINNFYKELMQKSFKKIEMYIYYRQLLYINKSKLNYTYLKYIENYLKIIFNKNVEFNIVNLKKFYLNSNILSESIMLKITRNRRSMLKYLNKLTNKVRTHKKQLYSAEIFKRINITKKKIIIKKHIY